MSRVERLIEQLYRERYGGFRDALTPVVGSRDLARDVVQEAFARALRERGRQSDDELPDDLTILNEERDPMLSAAVRSLPPKRRLILFLRYYADFTYAEIAEAVGVAEGTVAATLAQAHAALLDQLVTKEVAP